MKRGTETIRTLPAIARVHRVLTVLEITFLGFWNRGFGIIVSIFWMEVGE